MAQNRSSAVMAQRVEAPDSLDFFPTPPWATRALIEWLAIQDPGLAGQSCLEPACGAGHMARPLAETFGEVAASDCYAYGFGEVADFLTLGLPPRADWVITNPPFRLGLEFAARALVAARRGVALLVRTAFLEGGHRYEALFRASPPTEVLQFCERVVMVKGRLVSPDWTNPDTGNAYSTATSYCWVVWRFTAGHTLPQRPTHLHAIAPARRRLERPGDYGPPPATELAPLPLFGEGEG